MNLDAHRRAWLMREGSSLFRHYRSLRLPLSPKTQKSTENRCFFHALTEIRCRQNFPFFLTGETQHIDTPYLEVPVRFNMPIYAFLHNVLLVRKLNPHTKLQCSKTWVSIFPFGFDTRRVDKRNFKPLLSSDSEPTKLDDIIGEEK